MAGDQITGILQADLALDQRFRQIAKRANNAAHQAKQRALEQRNWQAQYRHAHHTCDNRAKQPASRALPGLLWAKNRGELMTPEATPDKVGRCILEPRDRAGIVDPSNSRLHTQLLEDRIVK